MDPLTPNKIQRLMHLAEDSSFNRPGTRMQDEFLLMYQNVPDLKPLGHHAAAVNTKESGTCESSSGLLDLDQIQGFGESDAGSISKATGFFPGEMTGRSTGTEDNIHTGRHSYLNVESLTKQSEAQSGEVNNIMRHSIATSFSLHSKNLTDHEASFVANYAPTPIPPQRSIIQEASLVENLSIASIGGYFRDRCPEFSKVLGQSNSPDRSMSSMQPSLTEVSNFEISEPLQQYPCKLDPSLDSVPVRQPRIMNEADEIEKQALKQEVQINQLLMSTYNASDYRLKTESDIGQFKRPQPLVTPKLEPQKQVKDVRKGAAGTSTELFVKAVTKSSIRAATEDESSVVDTSLSLSKIAELLGNHSVVDVSDMIDKFCKKDKTKPLIEANKIVKQELPVTYLKDSRNVDSANSAGTVKTVISMKSNQENRVPEVLITRDSLTKNADKESIKSEHTRSKSPSSRSRSTLSTVKENYAAESPIRNTSGEVKPTHVPSPNYEYRELDKSVDWQEVMQQARRRSEGFAEGPWIEIKATPVKGFVGVNCRATISITTKFDSWLTATFSYDQLPTMERWRLLRIELPRQPLLLSPGKTEQLTINITSTAELSSDLPFVITVKDSSIDSEQEQKGTLSVDFKMPAVQAISSSGPNKVVFSPTQERTLLATTLVLLSDCPVDLQLSLSLVDGKLFSLKNVQEIKMSEVNKALSTPEEKHAWSKLKKNSSAVQLCRLTKGNAIRATVVFEAPCRTDRLSTELVKYHGAVVVNLIGVEATLKTVELIASVGTAILSLSTQDQKACFSKEPKTLLVLNRGSIRGAWYIKPEDSKQFQVSASKVDVAPGETKGVSVTYTGPEDSLNKTTLSFEETTTGYKTSIEIQGGTEKFPIKTSNPILSWVRGGRKEISLKNFSDKKVLVRCDIQGDGFTIDVAGVEARGTSCIIGFGAGECRQLPVVFAPTTHLPSAAMLFMKMDNNSDHIKKINLYGCASGDSLRWVGLATYGETALVRAVARSTIDLKLTNKSPMPAFVCARVNFNLQYMSLAGSSQLVGARHVVRGRGAHTLSLRVDWARVERRALEARSPTLATLTALTGPELTRHRILRILRNESNGEIDTSVLPDNLKMLAGPFDGEEVDLDAVLTDFEETRASLVDLIGGLQELKAQIDLPVDLSEETIIIADDTVLEHHTLFD